MEYNPALPIYLQAANSIKRDIVTGKLPPGAKLPSVRDLAVEYTINPNTVSRVYKELESEGVCFTRRGMGTFVTEDPGKVDQMKEEMVHWELILSEVNALYNKIKNASLGPDEIIAMQAELIQLQQL